MTRFAIAVMCGPAFVLAVFVGITQGNPLAWGLAIGFAAPVVGTFLLLATPTKSLPRKADPAKIARMEVDLQTGPAWENEQRIRAHQARVAEMRRKREASEAPTTVAKPSCSCDYSGGACSNCMDAATFHGAPTFGHKIEGP